MTKYTAKMYIHKNPGDKEVEEVFRMMHSATKHLRERVGGGFPKEILVKHEDDELTGEPDVITVKVNMESK